MSGSGENDAPTTLTGVGRPDPRTIASCRIDARIPTEGSRLYKATDQSLGKPVVVKLMKPPFDDDPQQVERFLAFGGALVGLSSPHVVTVLRAGKDGPTPYIIFDGVDGEDLDSALKRERSFVPQAGLRVVLDAAAGLEAAQKRGVLHGDVRPRHLLRARGEIKVTGFGLSPPLRTAQGRVLQGQPAYLAPEIVAGQPADHRADMYALGCTLFELIAGRPPYGTASSDALLACHLHETFPSLRSLAPQTPPDLEAFLGRMVARDPEKRFATWSALLQAGAALLPRLRHLQPSSPTLIVEEGRQHGARFELVEGETLIGRITGDGIALDDARVSRRHATVRRRGDVVEVVDLGSRNGIRVNGVDVKEHQLTHGDRIGVGDSVLRLEVAGATTQPPAEGRIVDSPVRGAFGEAEVARPPPRQAQPSTLAQGTPSPERQQLLARLASLFAARVQGGAMLRRDAVGIVGEVLKADHHLLVRMQDGRPVFEASSAHEAQLLSGTLPAIERALPGQLSLLTTVRVNLDDRWSVLLAPVVERDQTTALALLVKRIGRFDADALTLLEGACALLALRAENAGA
jgi:pSer/pThr/pTyr-binding forkhead associated (FHA) protein